MWYVSEVKLEAYLLLLNGKRELGNYFFHEKLSLSKILWATRVNSWDNSPSRLKQTIDTVLYIETLLMRCETIQTIEVIAIAWIRLKF